MFLYVKISFQEISGNFKLLGGRTRNLYHSI